MSEYPKTSSILEAKSLGSEPDRRARLERNQGVTNADTVGKRALDWLGGSLQPGESSPMRRERGLRKVVGGVAVVAVALGSFGAYKSGQSLLENMRESQHKSNIQPLLDYQKDGTLEKGMVAVPAGNFEGTATAWVREHGVDLNDTEATQDLIDQVFDQSNEQGDPGVQPQDEFVVPRDEVNAETIDQLNQTN